MTPLDQNPPPPPAPQDGRSADLDRLLRAVESAHPTLTTRSRSPRTSPHALAARNLRIVLQHAFPTTTFLVAATPSARRGSVHVSWCTWEEGPTQAQVKPLCEPFSNTTLNWRDDGEDPKTDPEGHAFRTLFGAAAHVHLSVLPPSPQQRAARAADQLNASTPSPLDAFPDVRRPRM